MHRRWLDREDVDAGELHPRAGKHAHQSVRTDHGDQLLLHFVDVTAIGSLQATLTESP